MFNFKDSFSKIFKKWRLYLLISFLLSAVYFLLFIAIKEKQQIVFIITASFICSLLSWSMVFGLFGFFYTKLNKESKIFSTISFSSYWVYIMHLPLTFFISLLLYNSSIPHYFKFIINVVITYLILMILYKLVVEKTIIGKFLNGKKKNIK
ncbi:MAG: hypothetical protein HGB12_13990 [Bacteroidetes bacterium]|nr:hypothetical protein [Bacteroidota bacterium]